MYERSVAVACEDVSSGDGRGATRTGGGRSRGSSRGSSRGCGCGRGCVRGCVLTGGCGRAMGSSTITGGAAVWVAGVVTVGTGIGGAWVVVVEISNESSAGPSISTSVVVPTAGGPSAIVSVGGALAVTRGLCLSSGRIISSPKATTTSPTTTSGAIHQPLRRGATSPGAVFAVATGVPHFEQNAAPGAISEPHFAQNNMRK